MFRKNVKILILIFVLLGTCLNIISILTRNIHRNFELVTDLKPSSTNNTIYINGNSEFNTIATVGNGTLNNPYIIENCNKKATDNHGILIKNTDVYFIIRNVSVSEGPEPV